MRDATTDLTKRKPVLAATRLDVMRHLCDQIAARLRGAHLDEHALHTAEMDLKHLGCELEHAVFQYGEMRGADTAEVHAIRSGLSCLHEDLQWLGHSRTSAAAQDVHARLLHALRSVTNAVSLLRWSWG